jgi:hypothetical protein
MINQDIGGSLSTSRLPAFQSTICIKSRGIDFDTIPVHMSGAIRPANDDGHGPFRRLFRRPFESSGRHAGVPGVLQVEKL